MENEEIRVNWRAAIVPLDGNRAVYGHLSTVGKRRAVVKLDHNLMPGYRCNLALMLPKNTPDEMPQYIEGRGVVAASVHSATQFHITLDWLELKGNGESLLREHIGKYREVWKR